METELAETEFNSNSSLSSSFSIGEELFPIAVSGKLLASSHVTARFQDNANQMAEPETPVQQPSLKTEPEIPLPGPSPKAELEAPLQGPSPKAELEAPLQGPLPKAKPRKNLPRPSSKAEPETSLPGPSPKAEFEPPLQGPSSKAKPDVLPLPQEKLDLRNEEKRATNDTGDHESDYFKEAMDLFGKARLHRKEAHQEYKNKNYGAAHILFVLCRHKSIDGK